MKIKIVIAFASLLLGSQAFACKMTPLAASLAVQKAAVEYFSANSEGLDSQQVVTKVRTPGGWVLIEVVQDGQCSVVPFQVTINEDCSTTTSKLVTFVPVPCEQVVN